MVFGGADIGVDFRPQTPADGQRFNGRMFYIAAKDNGAFGNSFADIFGSNFFFFCRCLHCFSNDAFTGFF